MISVILAISSPPAPSKLLCSLYIFRTNNDLPQFSEMKKAHIQFQDFKKKVT